MKKTVLSAKLICRIAIMAALYVILALYAIKIGNLRITLASFPVIVTAVLFGPFQAACVAFLGEFANQMLSYGFTATTLVWCIPPVIRAVVVGFGAGVLSRGGQKPESRIMPYYGLILVAACITTAANTFAIWLDSVIYGYYTYAYVFGATLVRIVTGMVTALVLATGSIPVIKGLRGHI